MTARVMIVVTHLLGSGHLSRALTLGRGFASAGHEVHVVSGGFPAPQLDSAGLTLHQLAPLRSDGTDFARLLTPAGTLATGTDHAVRARILLDLLRDLAPDILMTELFPFGRRNLRDEFTALLAATHHLPRRPRVFASIRDILAPPSKPAKIAFADDMVARHYDAVLVHSDPDIIPLTTSWPVSPALADKLRYTGFVAPALPENPAEDGRDEVLVSAGGGGVGDPVFNASLRAAAGSDLTWRLLVGGADADPRIARLAAAAPANVTLEWTRPDFRAILRHAAASVSLCGYNTAMDILQTGRPAVFVPFDDGDEVEQGLRADALSHLPGIEVLPMGGIDGPALAAALGRARAAPPRDAGGFRFDGAQETVRLCTGDRR